MCIRADWCLVGMWNETNQTLYNLRAKKKENKKVRAEHPSRESKSDTWPLPTAGPLQERHKYDSLEIAEYSMHFITLVYTTSLLANVILYKATWISIMYFLCYDFGLISEKLDTSMLKSGYFLERKSGLSHYGENGVRPNSIWVLFTWV
jgi:hypothetical protein